MRYVDVDALSTHSRAAWHHRRDGTHLLKEVFRRGRRERLLMKLLLDGGAGRVSGDAGDFGGCSSVTAHRHYASSTDAHAHVFTSLA